MVDRQAIADEIFSVSEGSLATHKVWLLVNFIERMLADRPEAPAQTSCDNSSGQKVIAVPSCVPAPVCSKCGNTLGCVSCYNETANETREYRHHVLCSGDRRFPAGDPGHSCSCFELNPPPVPPTFPKERWTKHEIAEAIRSNYHYTEPGDGELFITKILAALDPPKPKPKTPEERVNAILVHHLGNEYVVKHTIAAEIVADHAAALAAKEREWWVRLGKFRKALDAAGLHGHYNLLQEHFQDESGKWEAKEREIETLKAQVERAEKSCSQLADGVVRYKAQVERLSAPLSLREYYDVSLMGDSNTQFDLLKRVIAARAAEKGPSNER